MNNKGQSLVMFVLVIPILFMIVFMVYEVGRMALLKHELNDINYLVIDYGLDKLEDPLVIDNVKELINKNKNDIDSVDVKVEDNKLYVTLEDQINIKLSLIKNSQIFKVKSSYVGYLDEDKKIIGKDG